MGEFDRATRFAVRLGVRGAVKGSRGAAQLTARLAPSAGSRVSAVSIAMVAGGLWLTVFTVIGAFAGGSGGAIVGLLAGVVLGGVVAWGLVNKGFASVAVSRGGISLGHERGRFGVGQPHVIDRKTRVRHVAVFGATGSGKSTAIKNLVAQDFAAPGRPGVMVVDIKDDLVLDIARRVPPERLGDVLLFDPTDTAFPPAFNPFAGVPAENRTLAAAELIAALKRLYAESWGPRLEHVLRAVVLTLLETPEATLLDIGRLITDPEYRSWAVGHVTNFSVQDFWAREWVAIVGAKGSLSNVESLLNKLSIFSYPEIRNVIGQTKRGLDLRRVMDRGKILLVNLPQGKLGEDASSFLAALVIGKTQLAAQSRVALAHHLRKPFYLFADEFQNYQTGAFDKLITEGRSMGIGVVAACQYEEQLPRELRLTLEKNCAYALQCRIENGRHRIVVVKQQEPTAPDAVTLLKPPPPWAVADDSQLATIRLQSRQQLGAPRAVVEADIIRRMQSSARSSTGNTQQGGRQQQQRSGKSSSGKERVKREVPFDDE